MSARGNDASLPRDVAPVRPPAPPGFSFLKASRRLLDALHVIEQPPDVVIGVAQEAGLGVYYLVGGEGAKARLDEMKGWLAVHNNAMAVLFLVFGAKLIADGLQPLT